jgi:hypothetical protein
MTPREQGATAFRHGEMLMDCPYARYSPPWQQWVDGWKGEEFSPAKTL